MIQRIKIKNIDDSPSGGIFITKKDKNTIILSAIILAILYSAVIKTKYYLKYKKHV